MGNFNRGGKSGGGFSRRGAPSFGGKRFGGKPSFGGRPSFGGGRDGGRPILHAAVCSECGSNCEVPFKPTGDRPVFCNACFGKQESLGARHNKFKVDGPQFRDDKSARPARFDGNINSAICSKCGQECQVPFRPMPGKPVFCNNCFDKPSSGNKDSSEILRQIEALHAKFDKLMKTLAVDTASQSDKPVTKEKTTPKKEKGKTKKVVTKKKK